MAKAEIKMVPHEIQVKHVVLELTPEEAQTLADITGRIGGVGRRDHVEDMRVVLAEVGFSWRNNETIAQVSGAEWSDISGTIRFHPLMPMTSVAGPEPQYLRKPRGSYGSLG